MDSEKFLDDVFSKSDTDYGMFCPPTKAQDGLNALIHHFLGEDWYVVMPVSQEQVNTEAVYMILRKYPKKKSFKDKIKTLLKRKK